MDFTNGEMIWCVEWGVVEHYADDWQFIPSTRPVYWKWEPHGWGGGLGCGGGRLVFGEWMINSALRVIRWRPRETLWCVCLYAEIIRVHLHFTEAQRGEDTCLRAHSEVRWWCGAGILCRKYSDASQDAVCSSSFPPFVYFCSRESSWSSQLSQGWEQGLQAPWQQGC